MEKYTPTDLPDDQLERLQKQIREVDELLGTSIVPASMEDDLMDLSIGDIKNIFRTRLSVFLHALQANNGSQESKDKIEEVASYIAALNNLDQYITNHSDDEESRTLRPHQFESFKKLRDFLEEGKKDGYFKLPTGYGKTVLFIEFLEALNLKTLIVAPTQPLVEQTQQKFGEFADEVDTGLVYSWAHEMGRDVTITTYTSFVSKVQSGEFKPEDYDCLILDEVHRSLSDSRIETVGRFEHAVRLGFTATPYFSEEKNVAQLLPHEIDKLELKDAIEEGMLSSVRVVLAQTDIDLANVGGAGDDYNRADLARAVNVKSRNQAAVEYYRKYFDDSSAICYCAGVQHADDVAKAFNEAGVPATTISGYMSPAKKQEILQAHHSGEIKVVCNADILVEGYDEPAIEVCFNLRPTYSWVFAEQRGGRAVRLDPDNSEKVATIVDFIDKNSSKLIYQQPVSFVEVLGKVQALNRDHQEEGVEIEAMEDDVLQKVRFVTDPEKAMEMLASRPIKIRMKRYVDEKFKEEEREMLEKGWMSTSMVAEELSISAYRAEKLGQSVCARRPKLMSQLKRKTSREGIVQVTFFQSKILPHLREAIERNTAPEGWLTKKGLLDEYALTAYEVQFFFEKHKQIERYSHEYGKYLFPEERPKFYYSPKLAEKMAIEMHREVPEGWVSLSLLARRIGIARFIVRPIATQAVADSGQKGRVAILARKEGEYRDIHYAPAMAEEIKRCALEQSEKHVESRQIASQYKKPIARVREALKFAQLSKPPVRVQDRNNKRKTLEYILSEDIPKLKGFLTLSRNWKSLGDLAAETGVHKRFVQRIFDRIKSEMDREYHVLTSRSEVGLTIYISPLFVQQIKKEMKSLKPKKGWMTCRGISQGAGISRRAVRALLKESGNGEVERRTFINKRGLMKPYYPPAAARHVKKEARAIRKWPTLASLAEELGDTEPRIRYLAIGYLIKNKDRMALVGSGRETFINPEAVESIKAGLKETEGWLDSTEYLGDSEIGYERMLRLMKRLQEERPELFRWGAGARGKVAMRMHPEVISLISEQYEEYLQWIPEGKLSRDLGLLRPELETLEQLCVDNNADQILPLYKGKKITKTLIGPELETRIRDAMEVPDGWMMLEAIIELYDLKRDDVEPFVVLQKTSHPENVKACWNRAKRRMCDYFAPSVAETIQVNMVDTAPKGWKTAAEIMDKYCIDNIQLDGLLLAIISPAEEDELTRQHRSASGEIELHYHPNVVSSMACKLPPPDGWLTFVQLARDYVVHPRIVKQLADSLGAGQPKWQKKFFDMDAGNERTFLHPELVELIEQEL